MNDRIKQVRRDAHLTQEIFARRIGVQKSAVSRLESGINRPSEQTTKLICREFLINPDWLKTGEQPMKIPANEAALAKISRLYAGDNEFAKRVLDGLADLPPETWAALEAFFAHRDAKKDRP